VFIAFLLLNLAVLPFSGERLKTGELGTSPTIHLKDPSREQGTHFSGFLFSIGFFNRKASCKEILMILLGAGIILSAVWLAPHVAGPKGKTYPSLQQSGAMIVRFLRWFDGSPR
jgi:hypothetical protein